MSNLLDKQYAPSSVLFTSILSTNIRNTLSAYFSDEETASARWPKVCQLTRGLARIQDSSLSGSRILCPHSSSCAVCWPFARSKTRLYPQYPSQWKHIIDNKYLQSNQKTVLLSILNKDEHEEVGVVALKSVGRSWFSCTKLFWDRIFRVDIKH